MHVNKNVTLTHENFLVIKQRMDAEHSPSFSAALNELLDRGESDRYLLQKITEQAKKARVEAEMWKARALPLPVVNTDEKS